MDDNQGPCTSSETGRHNANVTLRADGLKAHRNPCGRKGPTLRRNPSVPFKTGADVHRVSSTWTEHYMPRGS